MTNGLSHHYHLGESTFIFRGVRRDFYFLSNFSMNFLCANRIAPDGTPTFSKFYRRHYELISKFNVGLKTLLREGLSEPEFYCDLVYKFKKLKGKNDSFQFRKIITRYRRIGYNLNVMRQSACLVFNPIMVDNYAAFFNCGSGVRFYDGLDLKLFILVGWGRSFLSVAWPTGVQLAPGFSKLFGAQGSPSPGSLLSLLSPRF